MNLPDHPLLTFLLAVLLGTAAGTLAGLLVYWWLK